MTGIHFAHPSNRFWPAVKKAGLIDWVPNVSPIAPAVSLDISDQPWTAGTNCHPSNRFYPALRRVGLVKWSVGTEAGMSDEQRQDLTDRGIGITNLVNRATVRASELARDELRAGGERLRDLVEEVRPNVVAVAGVTAYRDAFGVRRASLGRQDADMGSAQLWVVPNPSGLNAHETIDSLANWYRQVAAEAGII